MYLDFIDPNTVVTDGIAINNAIRNILLTQRGTLPGKPRFGSDLHRILFNQLDHITINTIKTVITDALVEFEPRVIINDITVKDIPEYNRVIAHIDYSYRDKGTSFSDAVSINLTT